MCACMPWGDSTQVSSNFVKHLNLRHQFEYDTFVVGSCVHDIGNSIASCTSCVCLSVCFRKDYQQDEEQALQAVLEASRFEK